MGKRILIVSSDEKRTEKLAAFLSEVGYSSLHCKYEKKAVEVTLQAKPDLILCDSYLPIISGPELAKLFKSIEALAPIPFILITSNIPSLRELERTGFEIVADDYIQLPFGLPDLYGLITKWLESDERPTSIADRLRGALSEQPAAPKIKPWNKGKVTCLSMGKLFSHLMQQPEMGTLQVRDERKKIKAYIDSDRLVEVKSNYIREDALGTFLLHRGLISPKENELSVKMAQEKGLRQGQILVQMNLLTPQDLKDYITQQKIDKFIKLFTESWNGAAFEFITEKIEQNKFSMLAVSLSHLLNQAILKTCSSIELLDLIKRNGKEHAFIQFNQSLLPLSQKLELDSDQIELLKQTEGWTIRQLQIKFPDLFEKHLRLVFLLLLTKGLDLVEKTKTPAPRPTPRQVPKSNIRIEPTKHDRPSAQVPESFHQHLAECRSCINQKDFIRAKSVLTTALKENPYNSPALSMMAWAAYNLRGKNDLAAAVECKEMLKKAISIDGNNDEALVYLGKIYKDEGKESLAHLHFRNAFHLNPANEDAERELKLIEIKKRQQSYMGYRK